MPLAINQLTKLNFAEAEAKVYLAVLKSGPSTAQIIARRADLPRSSVYRICEVLQKRGLLTLTKRRGKRYFAVLDPREIEVDLEQKLTLAKNIVPALRQEMEFKAGALDFEYYEGTDNIPKIYKALLKQPGSISAFLSFGHDHAPQRYPSQYFIPQRAKIKKAIRVIASDTPYGRSLAAKDQVELRRTKLIPADKFPVHHNVFICGDIYAIINYAPPVTSYLIYNRSVANAQQDIFNLLWENL